MKFRDLHDYSDRKMRDAKMESSPFFVQCETLKAYLTTGLTDIDEIRVIKIPHKVIVVGSTGEPELESLYPDDELPIGYYKLVRDRFSEKKIATIAYMPQNSMMTDCFSRFVWMKEMMHLFDGDERKINSASKMVNLMEEIQAKPTDASAALYSERRAQMRALLVMCPREQRNIVVDEYERGLLGDLKNAEDVISKDFLIPRRFVKAIISDVYDVWYDAYID